MSERRMDPEIESLGCRRRTMALSPRRADRLSVGVTIVTMWRPAPQTPGSSILSPGQF